MSRISSRTSGVLSINSFRRSPASKAIRNAIRMQSAARPTIARSQPAGMSTGTTPALTAVAAATAVQPEIARRSAVRLARSLNPSCCSMGIVMVISSLVWLANLRCCVSSFERTRGARHAWFIDPVPQARSAPFGGNGGPTWAITWPRLTEKSGRAGRPVPHHANRRTSQVFGPSARLERDRSMRRTWSVSRRPSASPAASKMRPIPPTVTTPA